MRRFTFKVAGTDGKPTKKYVTSENMNEAILSVQVEDLTIIDVQESTVTWESYRKWLGDELDFSDLMQYVIEPALQGIYFDADQRLRPEDEREPTNIAGLIKSGLEGLCLCPESLQSEQDEEE